MRQACQECRPDRPCLKCKIARRQRVIARRAKSDAQFGMGYPVSVRVWLGRPVRAS